MKKDICLLFASIHVTFMSCAYSELKIFSLQRNEFQYFTSYVRKSSFNPAALFPPGNEHYTVSEQCSRTVNIFIKIYKSIGYNYGTRFEQYY